MSAVIQQYQEDKCVGFVYSISADIEDPRHMTAGVAVVFKSRFWKPSSSHLALQREKYGVSVYSLITKETYFVNPAFINYNAAFKHLTMDFQKQGLTHLVCSPIGCVRSNVTLSDFVKNLKIFQQMRSSKITNLSYYQESIRIQSSAEISSSSGAPTARHKHQSQNTKDFSIFFNLWTLHTATQLNADAISHKPTLLPDQLVPPLTTLTHTLKTTLITRNVSVLSDVYKHEHSVSNENNLEQTCAAAFGRSDISLPFPKAINVNSI